MFFFSDNLSATILKLHHVKHTINVNTFKISVMFLMLYNSSNEAVILHSQILMHSTACSLSSVN